MNRNSQELVMLTLFFIGVIIFSSCVTFIVVDTYTRAQIDREEQRLIHAKELELRLVISAARLGHWTGRNGEEWMVVSNRVWHIISTNK